MSGVIARMSDGVTAIVKDSLQGALAIRADLGAPGFAGSLCVAGPPTDRNTPITPTDPPELRPDLVVAWSASRPCASTSTWGRRAGVDLVVAWSARRPCASTSTWGRRDGVDLVVAWSAPHPHASTSNLGRRPGADLVAKLGRLRTATTRHRPARPDTNASKAGSTSTRARLRVAGSGGGGSGGGEARRRVRVSVLWWVGMPGLGWPAASRGGGVRGGSRGRSASLSRPGRRRACGLPPAGPAGW